MRGRCKRIEKKQRFSEKPVCCRCSDFLDRELFFCVHLPTYCQAAGASVAAVGMIASAYGLSQLLVRVPLGIVSDRIGRRKAFIVALGFGCLGVGAIAMAMFPTPAILFLGRLFTGISASRMGQLYRDVRWVLFA